MMNYLLMGLAFLSLVCGLLTGRIEAVSRAILEQSSAAVTLSLTLMGNTCLWSGLMEIAKRSGLTEVLARLLQPVTRRLFRGLNSPSARNAICMSITVNLLGVGNAATPLGLAAMEQLDAVNEHPGIASDHMITFVVLNTCSVQLLPTTVAALRFAAGSTAPFEILPAILCTSLIALMASLFAAHCGNRLFPIKKGALH